MAYAENERLLVYPSYLFEFNWLLSHLIHFERKIYHQPNCLLNLIEREAERKIRKMHLLNLFELNLVKKYFKHLNYILFNYFCVISFSNQDHQ